MSLLRWVPAERKDREALRRFQCTAPRTRVRRGGRWEYAHPAKYERAAQTLIRTRLAPVGNPHRTMLLGWHGDELGAVASYRAQGSAQYVIEVVAVATKLRRRGGVAWGLEALTTTLGVITSDADAHGYTSVTVMAGIHEQNGRSQRLFGSQGFQPTSALPDNYQAWSAELLIAGAAADL